MADHLPQPNTWQRQAQWLPAARLSAWLLSRTLHHLDRLILRLSAGRHSATAVLAGLPIITLTTIGAKSGAPRLVPLVGLPDGERFVVIASNWGQRFHPAWYHNLRANPGVMLSYNGRTEAYLAREVSGEEWERYWQRATQLYLGYALYRQRTGGRRIPIVVLTPDRTSA
jgi:deazaflavin-dependent oxidoreductase (nitroreductase family)